MKISIVIPAYNEEALIGRCLAAVVREVAHRGRGDVEIVVVDNGSTDRTADIAASFPNVRVVTEPARGIVKARSRGFEATSGELVANLDADTMMPPGWIDTVLAEFARDRELVGLSGPVYYDDFSAWQRVLVRAVYVMWAPIHEFTSIIGAGALLQGGNFVIKRSAWRAAGGYDTSIEFYGEDCDVARRLLQFGRVKWTFALPMVASGRRFKREGMVRTTVFYLINFLSTSFANGPMTRTHTDIR